jgi:hypothetical protein
MKRMIVVTVVGLAMMTAEAFAGNGDLIVDGKLGVGLTPSAPLTVVSSGSGQFTAGPSTTSYFFAGYDGGSYGRIGVWNNGYKNLAINEDGGYVGIGTVTPQALTLPH